MLSQTGISLLAFVFLIFYYCFTRLTRQKAPWNFTIIIDGNVKGYNHIARDLLQKHANGDASDKKLMDDDKTLLDPCPQDKKIIVFCEIGSRMEGLQESAILRLANHYKKNVMVFYITSGQREFEISNCEARQKNLNNSDADERALKDALSDFLELSPFQQYKSIILRALIISIIVTFLFMLMPTISASDNGPQAFKGLFGEHDIVKNGYASLDTELEDRQMVLQNISNLKKEMQKYERLFDRQNNRTDNLEKKVQQKYKHFQEVTDQQNIKFDNLEKEFQKYEHLQENNTQLKIQIDRLEKELQKYEHLQETNTKINDIEKKCGRLPEETTLLKNSLHGLEEQMRFLNKQFIVISKQLEDREQEIQALKKKNENERAYHRKFFNGVTQPIPQTHY